MNLEIEYSKIATDYNDFLIEFKRTVEKLLVRNHIQTAFGVYGRVKSFDSINEKVTSERVEIKESVTELNDLAGLRIVLLYRELKEKVVGTLISEFDLLNNPKEFRQSTDKFGYSSIHLILKIKDEWGKTPDWKHHTQKKIEVQVRTLSEHIWAETSHALFYKREENIPSIINRDLSKLSALLEVVDDKLQYIKDKVDEHFDYISKAPYKEILALDLNSETFRRVMFENSKGIYNLNDYKNKVLSSAIEKDFNILNVNVLDDLIAGKIDLANLDADKYVVGVIDILQKNKAAVDKIRSDETLKSSS